VPEESLLRASKRGMLQKLNTKKGKYQARFFVLQDSDLYYYTEAKVGLIESVLCSQTENTFKKKAKRAKNVLRDAVAAAAEGIVVAMICIT
jgi:hypothetical protein